MVRFFEWTKTQRKLQKARKDGGDDDLIQALISDLLYIKYYPKTVKYISLLAEGENKKRQEIREAISAFFKDASIDTQKLLENMYAIDPALQMTISSWVFKRCGWMYKEHWSHILGPNKKIYMMLGMEYKTVVKQRLSTDYDSGSTVSTDVTETAKDDQDDFFT
jgi:hypothetical protein